MKSANLADSAMNAHILIDYISEEQFDAPYPSYKQVVCLFMLFFYIAAFCMLLMSEQSWLAII